MISLCSSTREIRLWDRVDSRRASLRRAYSRKVLISLTSAGYQGAGHESEENVRTDLGKEGVGMTAEWTLRCC